ncbi:MAG: hypothetical protein EB141_12855 [Verrucomicrobia bacterium]|nr:hypothetical protein [Pseudomonadota bacterium]NDB76509.1 hypothetical protein [Verrucomicrobiota bacterium]NDD39515.1 hypothetical protein [Verrucomicrobiota bacterium]NDE98292.1 hypothetical protein [Verrucomicrobiota bacterium]
MQITIQLTSHAEKSRGETERQAEIFTLELKRNGDARDKFIRAFAEDVRRLAAAHNARFDREHA